MNHDPRIAARKIRLVATDIDGVWTDAQMYYGPDGECMKGFSTYDGMATALLAAAGIPTVILTSENSAAVARRAEKLGLEHVHLGVSDKLARLRQVSGDLGIALDEVAYIGDDRNDLDVLRSVGLSALVPNSPILGKVHVDVVTSRAGGQGAFREFADMILEAQAGNSETP